MSRLTRDGTAETVSRDQLLRRERGQGNIHFPYSADHEQDWQPYPVDPFSATSDDYIYIHFNRSCTSGTCGVMNMCNVYCSSGECGDVVMMGTREGLS